ncbi:MAG: hypothetical protein LBE38_06275 [Deltaproteobacteria bacterium]|nr:hypothetical protein [Deltaproteobacteria bacterium]
MFVKPLSQLEELTRQQKEIFSYLQLESPSPMVETFSLLQQSLHISTTGQKKLGRPNGSTNKRKSNYQDTTNLELAVKNKEVNPPGSPNKQKHGPGAEKSQKQVRD